MHHYDSYVRKIDTQFFIVVLRNDNIVHVHIKNSILVTVEIQAMMQEAYWKVTDIPLPFVFTGGEFVSITTEARANAIVMEDFIPITSTALVVRNLAQKMLADFYYKINKPKKPLRVFKNFDDGIEWLLTKHPLQDLKK